MPSQRPTALRLIGMGVRLALPAVLLAAAGCDWGRDASGSTGSASVPRISLAGTGGIAAFAGRGSLMFSARCFPDDSRPDGLLIDPPRSCFQSLSQCADGHVYQLFCDGSFCDCLKDGWSTATIDTPGCPDIFRAAALCGWTQLSQASAVSAASAGPTDPCDGDADVGVPGCSCVDGFVSCPTANSCPLEGEYVHPETGLRFALASQGTLFATHALSARYEDIALGAEPGFHGTWQLTNETLFMKTMHTPFAAECDDRVGSYALTMAEDCSSATVQLIEDDCMERMALTGAALARTAP